MEKELEVYGGKVYGVAVSNYGLEKGYLDYRALSEILGNCILNNTIYAATQYEDWELVCGDEEQDVYQFYIISEYGYDFLYRNTEEIVYYNPELDVYLWGVTHFGTGWDYVLTDIKIKEMN